MAWITIPHINIIYIYHFDHDTWFNQLNIAKDGYTWLQGCGFEWAWTREVPIQNLQTIFFGFGGSFSCFSPPSSTTNLGWDDLSCQLDDLPNFFTHGERERDHLVSIETCISNSFSHGFSLGVPWVFQSSPQVPSLPPAASCFGSAAGQIEVAAWLAAGSIVFLNGRMP